jgi:hypothetical protein
VTVFVKGGDPNTPFGVNEFLRSTKDVKREHYTVAASTVPAQTIDGVSGQKVLQRGQVMAKIINGIEAGKIGPYLNDATATAEVQTLTESGTITGGTYTITHDGKTTAPIAYNANAAAITSALQAVNINAVATGGPVDTTPVTLTFYTGGNVSQVTVDTTLLTGTTPGITPATTTPGVGAPADGRADEANIVGINDTFLPWQLMERDVEVAVVYEATAVQAWCYEMTAAGVKAVLSNTVATAMQRGGAAGKGVDINWK